ncbi:hypothetical protein TNIN_336961 [Trichonephila inaurata madagascariensis]|uniref:Uncharacterized protein n=1 Tax=Trichonephila inaurata madagascariensis TaxID=2747483 RepID=A0A8X7BN08_9ARAC|nr:hypothetical protein TNIN_336961 [Trichonephila inaurata madagascariensis]
MLYLIITAIATSIDAATVTTTVVATDTASTVSTAIVTAADEVFTSILKSIKLLRAKLRNLLTKCKLLSEITTCLKQTLLYITFNE